MRLNERICVRLFLLCIFKCVYACVVLINYYLAMETLLTSRKIFVSRTKRTTWGRKGLVPGWDDGNETHSERKHDKTIRC